MPEREERVVRSRERAGQESWIHRVEDAIGAELHRIAAEETGDTVPSRALRLWAKTHALGNQLRTFAKEVAQVVAMEPAVAARLTAGEQPTDTEVQHSVRNVITILGSPGRK